MTTGPPTLDRQGPVYVVDLGDGENRFTPDWLEALAAALDEVSAAAGPAALVTLARGRFWSNGLDLAWAGRNPARLAELVAGTHAVLARTLTLPVPTVAAVQGHAVAAGLMLALAHDVRVMRADRGFAFLPEVSIAIPFTPGMAALIQARLPHRTAHEAMTTGRRYGGEEALAAGIVDVVAAESEVMTCAVERAEALAGTAGPTLGQIKQTMYAPVLAALSSEHSGGHPHRAT
jgi:enoyl-CoA hydratase/carnithine racemase